MHKLTRDLNLLHSSTDTRASLYKSDINIPKNRQFYV